MQNSQKLLKIARDSVLFYRYRLANLFGSESGTEVKLCRILHIFCSRNIKMYLIAECNYRANAECCCRTELGTYSYNGINIPF